MELDDVSEVVLTHAHGDLIHETELKFLASPMARVMRRVLRQPLPAGFAPEPFKLDDGPFGAFARSRSLTDDGRIVAVDTPGHISVICVDDAGRHVMLAGDATDSLEQLYALRADAVAPDAKVHIATMQAILAHCAAHPTMYLPSHDPDSAERLADATTSAEPFTGHLHGVRVSKLMRRKSAWDPGLMGGVVQLRPDPGGRARPAACRSAEYEEDRADGEPGSNREPRL